MSELPLFFAPGATHGAPGLYLTGEDNLRLTTWGSLAAAVVTVEGRVIRPDGQLEPFIESHIPLSTRAATSKIFQRAEGFLTNVHVRVSTGAATRGQVYAMLEIVRGLTGAVIPLGTILAGYITNAGRLSWPEGPNEPFASGFGLLRTIVGSNPAAGLEISETVPTGARWRVRTIVYTLVTSVAVAGRRPILTIDDGANVLWRAGIGNAQTASQTVIYHAGVGSPTGQIDITQLMWQITLPADLWLAAGSRIRTVTPLLDAADDYSAPVLNVEEWLEP